MATGGRNSRLGSSKTTKDKLQPSAHLCRLHHRRDVAADIADSIRRDLLGLRLQRVESCGAGRARSSSEQAVWRAAQQRILCCSSVESMSNTWAGTRAVLGGEALVDAALRLAHEELLPHLHHALGLGQRADALHRRRLRRHSGLAGQRNGGGELAGLCDQEVELGVVLDQLEALLLQGSQRLRGRESFRP